MKVSITLFASATTETVYGLSINDCLSMFCQAHLNTKSFSVCWVEKCEEGTFLLITKVAIYVGVLTK